MLPLSIEFIQRASRSCLEKFITENNLSIEIAGNTFSMSHFGRKMRRCKLQEYLLGYRMQETRRTHPGLIYIANLDNSESL